MQAQQYFERIHSLLRTTIRMCDSVEMMFALAKAGKRLRHGGGAESRMSKKLRIGEELQAWITARKRHHLSHAHMQMACELGMNPRKLGKLDNADQEPWKLPLPAFIESLYRKRFGKDRPEVVHSIEERARDLQQKRAAQREAKRLEREEGS